MTDHSSNAIGPNAHGELLIGRHTYTVDQTQPYAQLALAQLQSWEPVELIPERVNLVLLWADIAQDYHPHLVPPAPVSMRVTGHWLLRIAARHLGEGTYAAETADYLYRLFKLYETQRFFLPPP